ncbi:hypothetical protein GGR42_001889 [Saonia flava]|uniref:DUF4097 domain-containing protein n=1 Tax=Saonia flava TaxID=523696 RepID=A0A846QW18_9FLAO|nr:DUF4097 family beta strand repeat-containing protein [Saonia flava]NJB71427.1 hypothetical protein [Saonia flava]
MKNIKTITLMLLLFTGLVAKAQETSTELFSIPLSNPNDSGKLVVGQISGSINVISYEGKEVIVKASFGGKEQEQKSKNGLKRIANTSLAISAEEKNNVVEIINEQWNKRTDLEIKVPRNFSLKLSTINNGDIYVKGINGEMEISNINGHIDLEDVSGSASANTTNGHVKASFKSITNNASMAFTSFNGDVDVAFPSSLKANIKAKSDMGEIYTDFNMVLDSQKPVTKTDTKSGTYKVEIESWVKGKINGGGPEMLFKNFNGDIMIRAN